MCTLLIIGGSVAHFRYTWSVAHYAGVNLALEGGKVPITRESNAHQKGGSDAHYRGDVSSKNGSG